MKILLTVLLVGLLICGCTTHERPKFGPGEARIIAARELNSAIRGKHFADAAGRSHEYRMVSPADWKTVVVEGNRWSLRIPTELGVGQYAWVTMDLDGRNPTVEGFGFSIE